jgi:hypothetical protein
LTLSSSEKNMYLCVCVGLENDWFP